MGDDALYIEVLTEYASESAVRRRHIQEYYDKKAWDDYQVYVHSLKSSSKAVGMMTLSEMAADLESASKVENEKVIKEVHDRAMKLYDSAVCAIKDCIEVTDMEERDDEEDFVIEFSPKN